MTCSNCQTKNAQNIRTAIHHGHLRTTCTNCSKLIQPNQAAAKNRREQQKKDFRKDLLQPSQMRDYARAYPEQARELYGDDAARRMS